MLRSKILLVGLALIPAAVLVTGHSSLGEAKGDECRIKPDSSSPAGLHWYYRVDRANNRHCWYLHEQGMRVHSLIKATSRNPDARSPDAQNPDAQNPDAQNPDAQNNTADEQAWKTPAVTGTPQPEYEQSTTMPEQTVVDFTARWVDLPKSVDLNAHELVAESNGYAAERGVDNSQQQLAPAWPKVSTVNGTAPQNAGAGTNFGSISLAGAVVLALLLISEALVWLARTSGRSLRRYLRMRSLRRVGYSIVADAPHDGALRRGPTEVEPISRTQTGMNELRQLLDRAGAGLSPPRSFSPPRSVHRHEHANRARAHPAFERFKSRSFNSMTWAPL